MNNPKSTLMTHQHYRNGDSHRDGADVSFADIVKLFQFKTAKVGKWVNKEEQQFAANLFFDAFCDLSDILQVPYSVISLRGTLSIAFGVGGTRHSKAHYNSATRTLSLAKNAGAGALAHEWFHAFDHYIASHMFSITAYHAFASEIWLNNLASARRHPLNHTLSLAFESIFLSSGQMSEILQRSVQTDKELNTFYYARPQEVCARAFERCIQDHRIKNSFLVAGTKQSQEAKLGLYPKPSKSKEIWQHFSHYFTSLGKAVSHKQGSS